MVRRAGYCAACAAAPLLRARLDKTLHFAYMHGALWSCRWINKHARRALRRVLNVNAAALRARCLFRCVLRWMVKSFE